MGYRVLDDNVYDNSGIVQWLERKDYRVLSNVNDLPVDYIGEIMLCCKQYYVTRV